MMQPVNSRKILTKLVKLSSIRIIGTLMSSNPAHSRNCPLTHRNNTPSHDLQAFPKTPPASRGTPKSKNPRIAICIANLSFPM